MVVDEVVAAAKLAIDGNGDHEDEADGGEIAEAGEIVLAVRIDDGHGRRQLRRGKMMIDDDDIDAAPTRWLERLDAGGAAIDGDDQRRAGIGELVDRLEIRAVAFEQPVGDVDDRLEAEALQISIQQSRGSRAVDIVIAEDRDLLLGLDGIGDAGGAGVHIGQHDRVGHQAANGRIEEGARFFRRDAAAGEHARQQVRHVVALGDIERERIALVRRAGRPSGGR